MNDNKLVLNEDKTEIILTGSAKTRSKINQNCLNIENNSIMISKTAKI